MVHISAKHNGGHSAKQSLLQDSVGAVQLAVHFQQDVGDDLASGEDSE